MNDLDIKKDVELDSVSSDSDDNDIILHKKMRNNTIEQTGNLKQP